MKDLQERIEILKAMHTLVKSIGDEDVYEIWIEAMPDEPDDGDFEWLAKEDEYVQDIGNTFIKLTKYMKHGMYIDDVFVKG